MVATCLVIRQSRGPCVNIYAKRKIARVARNAESISYLPRAAANWEPDVKAFRFAALLKFAGELRQPGDVTLIAVRITARAILPPLELTNSTISSSSNAL